MRDHTKKVVPIQKNWAEDLAAALGADKSAVGHPGPGWVSTREMMQSLGCSMNRATSMLEGGVKSGSVEKIKRLVAGRWTWYFKKK